MDRKQAGIPACLMAVMIVLFCSAGCRSAGTPDVETRLVEVGEAGTVRVLIEMEPGMLSIAGGTDDLLEASFTTDRIAPPAVDYTVIGDEGMLSVRQRRPDLLPAGRTVNRWDLRFNRETPLDLDMILDAGIHSIRLGGFSPTGVSIVAERGAALSVDLTGYWTHDLDVHIQSAGGSISLVLPRSSGARVEIRPGAGEITSASSLSAADRVYTNEAYRQSPVTLNVIVDPGTSEVDLGLGLPGDKLVADTILAARLMYSTATWDCASTPDDGLYLSTDTVRDLWVDYICEYGPEERFFDGADLLTTELAHSELIGRVRHDFYAGGGQPLSAMLQFNINEFVSATGDMLAISKDRETTEFSITHFIGSFDYTVRRDGDRVRFEVHNQTDRASGTHFPLRFEDAGYTASLEGLVAQDPALLDAYFLEVLNSGRYPLISLLDPKSRDQTEGDEGGGIFTQTFIWTEAYLDMDAGGLPVWPEVLPFLDIQ